LIGSLIAGTPAYAAPEWAFCVGLAGGFAAFVGAGRAVVAVGAAAMVTGTAGRCSQRAGEGGGIGCCGGVVGYRADYAGDGYLGHVPPDRRPGHREQFGGRSLAPARSARR